MTLIDRSCCSVEAVLLLGLLPFAVGCGDSTPTTPHRAAILADRPRRRHGAAANAGSRVTVSYTGWLYDASKTDAKGMRFDSSQGFSFVLALAR